jgi:hypothetical protein
MPTERRNLSSLAFETRIWQGSVGLYSTPVWNWYVEETGARWFKVGVAVTPHEAQEAVKVAQKMIEDYADREKKPK